MFMGPGFTISAGEQQRLWQVDNEKAEHVRQRILSFLDGILALGPSQQVAGALERVVFICRRFPIFARQLRSRERARPPLQIKDEYDLQYLLLALFRLKFDNVGKEVWTPAYAGSNARMDFLLKQESIIVEAKMTRENLLDHQVGDQLIVDIERYSEYPGFHTLVCMVYDPDHLLDNPRALEQDLSGPREKIKVVVLVSR